LRIAVERLFRELSRSIASGARTVIFVHRMRKWALGGVPVNGACG
jgi:hypothetical protein